MSIFFFRFLHSLKKKVKDKTRVEDSTCEAYLVEEISTLASFYYVDHVETRKTRIPHHNLEVSEGSSCAPPVSIFNYPGRGIGKCISRDSVFAYGSRLSS